MKNRDNFKKKKAYRPKNEDEIRLRERKKLPKRFSKQNIYDMLEEAQASEDYNLYIDDEE